MSRKVSPTLVGVFVIGAVTLIIAALFVFGGGRLFSSKDYYVVFFDSSIKGLGPGSPVNFRGARVGSVKEINVVYNKNDKTIRIPVVIELERGRIKGLNTRTLGSSAQEEILKNGVRAELGYESFVTGQKNVSLDFKPETPARLLGGDSQYVEIPSIPSPVEALTNKIENLPLEQIVATFQHVLLGLDKIVNSPDTGGTVQSLTKFLDEGTKLLSNANGEIQPLAAELRKLLDGMQKLLASLNGEISASKPGEVSQSFRESLAQMQRILTRIEELLRNESPEKHGLNRTVVELGDSARALRELVNYLDQHPESLIRGKR